MGIGQVWGPGPSNIISNTFLASSALSKSSTEPTRNHPPVGSNGWFHMNVPPQVHLHRARTVQDPTVPSCYIFNRSLPSETPMGPGLTICPTGVHSFAVLGTVTCLIGKTFGTGQKCSFNRGVHRAECSLGGVLL